MSKCTNEIYIPIKGSLLPMWESAMSIFSELQTHEEQIVETLGFGLYHRFRSGTLDVRQTILTTRAYCA